MRKSFLACLFFATVLSVDSFADSFNIEIKKDKWNLVGSSEDINISSLGLDESDTLWHYSNGEWYINKSGSSYSMLDNITANSSFWIYSNNDKNITIEKNTNKFTPVKSGWSMYSSSGDMNLSNDLNSSNVQFAWKYDDDWKLWNPNNLSTNISFETFDSVKEGEGIWIYSKERFSSKLIRSASDDIEDIWNITVPIDITNNYDDFDIGIKFIKYEDDGSDDIGEFIYNSLSIDGDSISTPTYIAVQGSGDSGNGNTYFYSGYNPDNIIDQSISIEDNKLLLNLGLIMKKQNMVNESTFKVKAKYKIYITSDKDIIESEDQFSLNIYLNNSFRFDSLDKKGIIGEIEIK